MLSKIIFFCNELTYPHYNLSMWHRQFFIFSTTAYEKSYTSSSMTIIFFRGGVQIMTFYDKGVKGGKSNDDSTTKIDSLCSKLNVIGVGG